MDSDVRPYKSSVSELRSPKIDYSPLRGEALAKYRRECEESHEKFLSLKREEENNIQLQKELGIIGSDGYKGLNGLSAVATAAIAARRRYESGDFSDFSGFSKPEKKAKIETINGLEVALGRLFEYECLVKRHLPDEQAAKVCSSIAKIRAKLHHELP